MRSFLRTLLALAIVFSVIVTPLVIRQRNTNALIDEYASIQIGSTPPPSAEIKEGAPPVRYRNHVAWQSEGRREDCVKHAIRHGGWLAVNYAWIIGVDGKGRVAYKEIGNT